MSALHIFGVGAFFIIGEATYMSMRAHFMVTGPRPVALNYTDFIKRAWGPLLFRFMVENALFWTAQNPYLAEAGLKALGWETFAFYCTLLRFMPVALGAGLLGDVLLDFAVVKLPYLRDVWPQMPPPLPQPAVVKLEVVAQNVIKVQETTTMVTDPPKQ